MVKVIRVSAIVSTPVVCCHAPGSFGILKTKFDFNKKINTTRFVYRRSMNIIVPKAAITRAPAMVSAE